MSAPGCSNRRPAPCRYSASRCGAFTRRRSRCRPSTAVSLPNAPASRRSASGASGDHRTLRVLAAASLTNAFTELGEKFSASHDGVTVQPGDTIGRLHFVNENLPVLAAEGATLRWAVAFGQMLRSSLHDLATYLDDHAELDAVALFEGRFGFVTADEAERTVALAARFGFEFSYQPSPGLRFWTAGFWENLGTWVMIRAFNPAGLHTKSFTHLMRATVRMTRTTLITH